MNITMDSLNTPVQFDPHPISNTTSVQLCTIFCTISFTQTQFKTVKPELQQTVQIEQ